VSTKTMPVDSFTTQMEAFAKARKGAQPMPTLSDEDIERAIKDAEANAEADKGRRELVEARNQAESLIHSTRKSLEEHGDKVDGSTVEAIELAVGALEEAIKSDDAGKIRGGIQNLMDASMKLGEAMYKAQAEAGDVVEQRQAGGAGGAGFGASGLTVRTWPDCRAAWPWPAWSGRTPLSGMLPDLVGSMVMMSSVALNCRQAGLRLECSRRRRAFPREGHESGQGAGTRVVRGLGPVAGGPHPDLQPPGTNALHAALSSGLVGT